MQDLFMIAILVPLTLALLLQALHSRQLLRFESSADGQGGLK
jgi:hypothetical protein